MRGCFWVGRVASAGGCSCAPLMLGKLLSVPILVPSTAVPSPFLSPPKQCLPLWSSPKHPPSTTPMLWLWLWPLLWSQILPSIHKLLSYIAAFLLSDAGLKNTRIHAQSDSAVSYPRGHPKPRAIQPDTFHLGKILQSQGLLQRMRGQPFFLFWGKEVSRPISIHFLQGTSICSWKLMECSHSVRALAEGQLLV